RAVTPHPPTPPLFFLLPRPPPRSPLFPYTTLFRSQPVAPLRCGARSRALSAPRRLVPRRRERSRCAASAQRRPSARSWNQATWRSEEHTSELQSRENLVCRLLLEKKKKMTCSVLMS